MDKKASLSEEQPLDIIEEAMARARLKRMRAKPSRRPPPRLGHDVRKLVRKHAKGNATSISKLKDNWESLVGEELAKFCRPEKLTGSKSARTLVLRVVPAAATRIQHESETIRQRVSVTAGGMVAKLKIVQGPLEQRKISPLARKRALTATERADLQKNSERIENPKLRAALLSLGEAVITRET
ncbi:MAG: DciA family protein [Hyphomonadaceae bacterium]